MQPHKIDEWDEENFGGFEKIEKPLDAKKGRRDTKRISPEERKKIVKNRKQQKMQMTNTNEEEV